MISAGQLFHQVEIFSALLSENSYGEQIKTYVSKGYFRASISPIQGNESFMEQGIHNDITHKILMRFIPSLNVKPDDIIVFNDREFDIQYVLNWFEKNKEITILAKEKLYVDRGI
jgi:SPP1 family predicted phage head-tail adaptor